MKHLLPIAVLLFAALSCEIPFDLDQAGEEKIYVQCVADGDQVSITPLVAHPVNQMAGDIPTLQLDFRVNGLSVPLEEKDGQYTCPLSLAEGDALQLDIRADGLPSVSGSTQVPERPVIVDFSSERVQVDTIDATEIRLTLDHVPGEGEYYGIQIFRRDFVRYMDGSAELYESYATPGYILTAAESGSFDLEDFMQVNYNGSYLGGKDFQPLTLVTRKQFSGAVYKFYLNSFDASILENIRDTMPEGDTGVAGGGIISGEVGDEDGAGGRFDPGRIPIAHTAEYYFRFYRLSDAFYYYAKALYQSNFDFLANMGLIPANFTWSNVQGGLGFVGAASAVELGPLVEEK